MFVTIRFVARVALDAVVLCLFAGSLAQGQFGPQKHEPKGQWENKSLSPDERADLVIGRMTLEEKSQLLHGLGWEVLFNEVMLGPPPESGPGTRAIRPSRFIPGVPRLGIPDLQITDAAVGARRPSARGRELAAP
jgi:beta-glucosidase